MRELFYGDFEQRAQRLETNFKFVLQAIEKIHESLCPGETGIWQDRVQQAVDAAAATNKELQNTLDIIGNQTYVILVLKNGLERLRNDTNWHGVDEVNGFIDKLLAVTTNVGKQKENENN